MDATGPAARVLRPGALTTLQDRGRPGFAHLGVPRSGALDPDAHALANRLVGNMEAEPVLETTVDGVTLRFETPSVVAVTGAVAPLRVEGGSVAWSLPVFVGPGQTLDVGAATAGLHSYIAVAGGWRARPELGSVASDLLSGLGPPPLAVGDGLEVGARRGRAAAVDIAPYPVPAERIELRVRSGPRLDWLTPAGIETLFGATFEVASTSNRIALRLRGPGVERSRTDELASEGIVWGAVQSLPDGGLVVFLADHPTTGGYPVVAVVDPVSFSACAQIRPGAAVTLRKEVGIGRPSDPARTPPRRSVASAPMSFLDHLHAP
jgi:biotin-dependent carboxylase-like uncharacterized protein